MPHLYELRTYVAAQDQLEALVEQWEQGLHQAVAACHPVLGAFVAHPERAVMPTGVALLLRHDDAADAERGLVAVPGTAYDELVASVTRQFLQPMQFSALR
ncbi:MAG TPA: hypothetical protein VFR07_13970 [Mycobacteriales bacterium]|nr:hypothetical protein [Mycobacteriales bacterium]